MTRGSTALQVIAAAAVALSSAEVGAETPAIADELSTPSRVQHFVFGQALAIFVRRVSVGYELLPAPHHSFGITVHGQWPGTKYLSLANGEVAGFGGEIGYRYYGSERGPTGPFFAVSFLGGHYHSRETFLMADPTARWFTQYGWAIDLGWSTYVENTIVIAMGLGVQRTWTDAPPAAISASAQLTNGEGLRPRAMFQVGRVF